MNSYDFGGLTYIVTALGAWLIAQLLKILFSLEKGKITWQDFFTSGGNPSSHVALVTSMAFIMGLMQGFDSAIFAVMFTLWSIVCYDAMGVRRATGENARILQQIIQHLKLGDQKRALYLALGHSPYQVFTGFVLGIVWSATVYFLIQYL